jgi:hypothetical protein
VYTPTSGRETKSTFYKQLTKWTKGIEGDKVLGGDWNMTLDVKDQKRVEQTTTCLQERDENS